MRRTFAVRAGVVIAFAAAATLTFAAPASAHVSVNPNTAVQGGYTKVAFRVPNERDAATTDKLEINLPTDKPIASVSLKPVAGWTAKADKTTLPTPVKTDDGDVTEAITKITWTAAPGTGIAVGQFQEFEVSLGPLPVTDQIVFKALQTYSDGEVVRWIDEPANGAEADHPAPILKLTKKAADAGAAGTSGSATADAYMRDGDDDGNDGVAIGLGIAGLVLGAAGLAAGLLAYRKASRATA